MFGLASIAHRERHLQCSVGLCGVPLASRATVAGQVTAITTSASGRGFFFRRPDMRRRHLEGRLVAGLLQDMGYDM